MSNETRTDAQAVAMKQLLHLRGVDTPCQACHGMGTKVYGSTATWRGGVGGAAMTHDVCDVCWGSGDQYRHGVDLRRMTAKRAAWERDQVFDYLARSFHVGIERLRGRFMTMAEMADAQSRKRKLPNGENEFNWRRDWEAVAVILRAVAQLPPTETRTG